MTDWAADLITKGYKRLTSPQELMRQARANQTPHERMQSAKRQTRYCYTMGPMYYLGQQIVKAMQDSGYPAQIQECFRSFERQHELYERVPSVTKAPPGNSPHQYYEAVDIVHPSLYWNVTPEYWTQLARCVAIVGEKFGVQLEHGHNWRFVDSAHIQLPDWKKARERYLKNEHDDTFPYRPPTEQELLERFQEVLPVVMGQHQKTK